MRVLTLANLSVGMERSQNETHHQFWFYTDGLEVAASMTLDEIRAVARGLSEYADSQDTERGSLHDEPMSA